MTGTKLFSPSKEVKKYNNETLEHLSGKNKWIQEQTLITLKLVMKISYNFWRVKHGASYQADSHTDCTSSLKSIKHTI